jgi:RimJ/RimL family protein N-acetyltransferase
VADWEQVLTERLELRAATAEEADVAGLHPIVSDPETWRHAPGERHTGPEQTRDWLARAAARWDTPDRLSYWLVRERDGAGDGGDGSGAVVGVGGVQRRRADGMWNLYYRFSPAVWGRGYATELSRAAVEAARAVDPEVPVVAWILAHNTASRRVAERLGFLELGERMDANNGQLRLAYADREF